ncbi:MAG: phosphohistidine phosphatase SixA [Phycisphaerales bacterium]|nr:phosphohistidine phosphatase SixA [Phycisphaerales bacterium]
MQILLLRHGKAEKESASGRDSDRRLTDKGRAQAEFIGAELYRAEDRPRLIVSSGLVRSRETAKIVAAALGCPLRLAAALETGHGCHEVIELLGELGDETPVMLVGHLPQLDDLLAELVGRRVAVPAFRTGECFTVRLQDARVPGGSGVLVRGRRMASHED